MNFYKQKLYFKNTYISCEFWSYLSITIMIMVLETYWDGLNIDKIGFMHNFPFMETLIGHFMKKGCRSMFRDNE